MVKIVHPEFSWRCLLCGKCCRDQPNRKRRILLTDYDLERIKKLKVKTDFFKDVEPIGAFKYQMLQKDGKCVFLSFGRCMIYEDRPLICRFYPFAMIKNDFYTFHVDPDCPGVGRGNRVNKRLFIELVEEAENAFSNDNLINVFSM
ncbi:MAG: YkgJ family cysteine cluster protein [Nitrososphaeria archaeon]